MSCDDIHHVFISSLYVPQQPNTKDCACFAIYFAKKFFYNPTVTMHLIEVSNNTPFIHMMTTDNILQNPRSDED